MWYNMDNNRYASHHRMMVLNNESLRHVILYVGIKRKEIYILRPQTKNNTTLNNSTPLN